MSDVTSTLPCVDPSDTNSPALTPGARVQCLYCDGVLIAKCGQINRWHWAHEADGSDCVGSEGEGHWHLSWKAWAERRGANTEVQSGHHRADIVWPDGDVWELQSTYLGLDDIAKREAHYGDRLTWVYRWTPARFNRLWNCGGGWFRWNRPAWSMAMSQRPIVWHLNDRLYDVTFDIVGDEVRVKFARGADDEYGPVMYGSRPAPFGVADAVDTLRRIKALPVEEIS